jgi:hypothetical protein
MMEKCSGLCRALIGLAVMVFTVVAAPAWAADDTTGKVSIEAMTVGVGLGVTWGTGVLEYRGQEYPFTVTGFSVGDLGAAKVVAKGEVYNLQSAEDFAGVFMAAVAGATLGGGAGAAAMKNQRQVDMVWTAAKQGVSLSLAQAGLNVKLTEAAQQRAARARRDASAEDQPSATPRTTQ